MHLFQIQCCLSVFLIHNVAIRLTLSSLLPARSSIMNDYSNVFGLLIVKGGFKLSVSYCSLFRKSFY